MTEDYEYRDGRGDQQDPSILDGCFRRRCRHSRLLHKTRAGTRLEPNLAESGLILAYVLLEDV